ncbi:MAG TPA: glycosyltransferase family 1 protein [Candidatus Limnocylindria bacterium]|nr:glycosyltransferase family 1 protein [Candidatus Limnocylindria bacterium]
MTIAIEAERANNPVKTGVEHYAKQLILNLAKIDRVNFYILYLRTQPENWFLELPSNFKIKVMPFPLFWTQLRISWEMLLHPVDVLFIPASALPLVHPKKSFVTIHDIAWKLYPDSFTWFMRNFLDWSTGFAVKRAAGIIAVSQSTKKDLVKFYGVAESKVSVVHHGYESSQPSSASSQLPTILPERYVLFLSTLQPRKNLEGLIDAFKQLKKENPELSQKLVVVGKPGWMFMRIMEKINSNKDNVIYLNHLKDAARLEVLRKADLLVLPSFYEGFGMQVLEAFAFNVPVATSNISSLPEVAGDAAIYFNPYEPTEIKNSIKAVLLDKSLAERLKENGKKRLANFSWEKCARETLEILTKMT